MTPRAFTTKSQKLPGTRYADVYRKAYNIYKPMKRKKKRRPFIRSAYFDKDKVFLGLFWHHLKDKLNLREKTRRLKYLPCALELIKNSKLDPVSKQSMDKAYEILHRFMGITIDQEVFCVQIKENKKNNQKFLISVFPIS
jgi:hypothetical protein